MRAQIQKSKYSIPFSITQIKRRPIKSKREANNPIHVKRREKHNQIRQTGNFTLQIAEPKYFTFEEISSKKFDYGS